MTNAISVQSENSMTNYFCCLESVVLTLTLDQFLNLLLIDTFFYSYLEWSLPHKAAKNIGFITKSEEIGSVDHRLSPLSPGHVPNEEKKVFSWSRACWALPVTLLPESEQCCSQTHLPLCSGSLSGEHTCVHLYQSVWSALSGSMMSRQSPSWREMMRKTTGTTGFLWGPGP